MKPDPHEQILKTTTLRWLCNVGLLNNDGHCAAQAGPKNLCTSCPSLPAPPHDGGPHLARRSNYCVRSEKWQVPPLKRR